MTITAPVALAPRKAERAWARLAWVAWRLDRTSCVSILVLMAALGTYMLMIGISTHGTRAAFSNNPTIFDDLAARWGDVHTAATALGAFPILVGVFVGAPMLARELESGTYRFSWMQGIDRTKLFTARLLWVTAALAAGAAILGGIEGWTSMQFPGLATASPWQPGQFDVSVLVLTAWILLAVGLGAWIGALTRRVVSAMAVTAAALGAALALTSWKLYALIRTIAPAARRAIPGPGNWQGPINEPSGIGVQGPAGSWILRGWYSRPSGQVLGSRAADHVAARMNVHRGFVDPTRWLRRHHLEYWVSFQPHGRLILFEVGMCLALVILAGCCWLLARRTLRRGA